MNVLTLYSVMETIWKDIEGFEGLYQVSAYGNVICLGHDKLHKGGEIAPMTDEKGRQFVRLYKDGKRYPRFVHRLVADAFIPNINNLTCVYHKDGNKRNNNADNLMRCSYAHFKTKN